MKTILRGEQGGKGSESKYKNNVQERAHVITWQEEAFPNQSINHGAGSSQASVGAGSEALHSQVHIQCCKEHRAGAAFTR